MARFIVRRLIVSAFVLFVLSIAVFTLVRVMPGDGFICPGFCTKEQIEAIKRERGLDKPYFPVSLDMSADQDWWMLLAPVTLAGFGLGMTFERRRLRAHHA